MKSKKLFAAIGNIDDKFISGDAEEPSTAESGRITVPFYRRRTVYRYTGLAACVVVVALSIWAIPGLFSVPIDNPVSETPYVPGNTSVIGLPNTDADSQTDRSPFDPGDMSIIGLPVDNFNLAELHSPDGVMASRIAFFKLSDFYAYDKVSFAYVRVTETKQWTDSSRFWGASEVQTSTLHVLSSIWSGGELPETVSVTQSKYGGCCANEETNLLRVGGVYLLPLSYWEEGDTWYITGDLDVLFEVDDQGRIWSHSQFDGFNQFDGQDAGIVAGIVTTMTSDENFPSAVTYYGRIARAWGVVAELTVLSVNESFDKWGYSQAEYRVIVDNVISIVSMPWHEREPMIRDEITVFSPGQAEHIAQGGRYLVLLDLSENGPYIDISKTAQIADDGTITAMPSSQEQQNIFTEFDGYTISHMREEARRAKLWHETYAD